MNNTKLIILLFSLLLMPFNAAQAQPPALPTGYSYYPENKSAEAVYNIGQQDFDKDGAMDSIALVTKTGEDAPVIMALLHNGKTVLTDKGFDLCCQSLALKNDIVTVQSTGMRGFSFYKFRWEAKAKDFRLIGYDIESAGNALNDGSGTASLNLLTGDFFAVFHHFDVKKDELVAWPPVKRKTSVKRVISLTQFNNDTDEWLASFIASQLPREMQ